MLPLIFVLKGDFSRKVRKEIGGHFSCSVINNCVTNVGIIYKFLTITIDYLCLESRESLLFV